jgi:hypothetical protein
MLSLSNLFAGYNIISTDNYTVEPSVVNNIFHKDRPSIVIKLTANLWIRVTELRKGYYITFEYVRMNGQFHRDVLIGQFNSIAKVREVIAKIAENKNYGLKLAFRYIDPIVLTKVYDKFGDVVRGVDAVRKSEMESLTAQGYTFKSITSSDTELKSMKKSKIKYTR